MAEKKEQQKDKEEKEAVKKTEQEQQDNNPEEGPESSNAANADPHRGTSDTLSQHKGLNPDGERNNDDEYYDEDGAMDEELDDLDDLDAEEE